MRREERRGGREGAPLRLPAVPTAFSAFQLSRESHCLFFFRFCFFECLKPFKYFNLKNVLTFMPLRKVRRVQLIQ